jgi:predicted CXXCH cytochrome family protein
LLRPLAIGVLLAGLGCTTPQKEVRPAAPVRHARLFVTSELKGYLGPCGCSENMRGGIARTAFQVVEARKAAEPVFFIDSGDALFGAPEIPAEAVPQQERKAQALADALKLMGLNSRAVGPLDDARGKEFRTSLGLPEFPPSQLQLLDIGGAKIAVVNAETLEQLGPRAAAAKAAGARFVLGLVQQPFDVVSKAASEGLPVDFVLATRSKDEFSSEANKLVRGATPVAQVQSKGRTLLTIELTQADAEAKFELLRGAADTERELAALDQRIELLRAQVNEPMLAEQLMTMRKAKLEEVIARREALASAPLPEPAGKNVFSARFIPIEASFPTLPAAVELVTAYDRDVGELNLKFAKEHGKDCSPPEKGKAGYVGNAACLECHDESFPVWNSSKHASAYPTLVKLGKNNHLDCVGCHVTGWQQPGGTCRIDRVAGRDYVGCESCHGPGSAHVAEASDDNIGKGNEPKVCTGCHDPENSPHFEFDAYVAKILGPGHGEPGPDSKARPGVKPAPAVKATPAPAPAPAPKKSPPKTPTKTPK